MKFIMQRFMEKNPITFWMGFIVSVVALLIMVIGFAVFIGETTFVALGWMFGIVGIIAIVFICEEGMKYADIDISL